MNPQSVLSCFSVAVLAIGVWAHTASVVFRYPSARAVILGLLMGAGAIAVMFVPMQVEPGQIVDLRSPLLACAGLFGGPMAAAIAAAMTLVTRAHLAGIGMWAGLGGIAAVSVCGAGARSLLGRAKPTNAQLVAFAATVTVISILPMLLLPANRWAGALESARITSLVNFGCTLLFTLSMRRDDQLRSLLKRNAIYRAVIDTLPDSLNAKDVDSRFVAANPATAHLMQAASADDLIGRSDADFYPADMAASFRNEELVVLDGRTVGPIDQEVRFADGTVRWLTTIKTPLRDGRGRVTGIITHNRDVTGRKMLERDLLQAQGYLQQAMASIADGVVLFDTSGVIQFCNDQYRDLFPKTRDLRVAGSALSDILRAAVERGEETAKEDLEGWIVERTHALLCERDWLIELADGRLIEARSRPIPGSSTLVVYADVTLRKHIERDLLRRATHDPLTGLPNRAEFDIRLRDAHLRAAAVDAPFALIMMDLDGFKQVNDTFGHVVGDKLLVEVAGRLRGAIRSGDLVARLGGDEFAFLIFGNDVQTGSHRLAERVLSRLRRPVDIGEIRLIPGGSIGIAVSAPGLDPVSLVHLADRALYTVKRSGKGGWSQAEIETESAFDPTGKAA